MTDAPLRAIVAGYGFAGSSLHHPLLVNAGFSVVGALARSGAAVDRATAQGLIASSEPDALAELAPDVVVVAVPDDAHEETLATVLGLGAKAIVIDKPVAPSSEAALRMAAAAGDAGVTLVPFHNRRWDGDFLLLKSLLDDRRLGDVLRVSSRFTHWSPKTGSGWRSRARGGVDGWLGDLGSHLVDQLVTLLGPVGSVSAEIRSVRDAAGPNDDCLLTLHHKSGASSSAFMSAVSPPIGARFEAQGTEGTFTIAGEDPQFAQIFQGLTPADPAWGSDPERASGQIVTATSEGVPVPAGDWTGFYTALARFLRGDAAVPVTMTDAIHGLNVLEAARRAASSNSVVEVG